MGYEFCQERESSGTHLGERKHAGAYRDGCRRLSSFYGDLLSFGCQNAEKRRRSPRAAAVAAYPCAAARSSRCCKGSEASPCRAPVSRIYFKRGGPKTARRVRAAKVFNLFAGSEAGAARAR